MGDNILSFIIIHFIANYISIEPLDQTWACLYSFWCFFHADSKYIPYMKGSTSEIENVMKIVG